MSDQQRTKLQLDAQITIALLKCCIEQSTTVIGYFKQADKAKFNLFTNQGWMMLRQYEASYPEQMKDVEAITDQLHEIIKQCKKATDEIPTAQN